MDESFELRKQMLENLLGSSSRLLAELKASSNPDREFIERIERFVEMLRKQQAELKEEPKEHE